MMLRTMRKSKTLHGDQSWKFATGSIQWKCLQPYLQTWHRNAVTRCGMLAATSCHDKLQSKLNVMALAAMNEITSCP